MGTIFAQIDKEIRNRAKMAQIQGFRSTKMRIGTFYSQGSPVLYVRTGTYKGTPQSSGVSGGNGEYHYEIHLETPSYNTGKHDGATILEDIQNNGSGVLGKPGTWDEAVRDIEIALRSSFSS